MLAALVLSIAGCAGGPPTPPPPTYKPQEYQWEKHTQWIKVHWNYLRPAKNKMVAEGFVEPFDPGTGVHTVRLELVAMDDDGNIVNFVSGRPVDTYIVSPYDESPFKLEMTLTGKERDFTIRGSYYHYDAGRRPDYSTESLDYIPLHSDEPL